MTPAVPAALYNRYRPRTFGEVIGQEHVTRALAQALAADRIHHAYLFSGPRGCGKTSSARILAASLNCVHGPTAEPCGECVQCRGIRDGSSVDVVEIDAASHGLVDDTRELRERANYVPASARYRVFVIDEAHMISPQGFNALLKIVEEPPEHVLFIFATTDPEKVLGTIRSRTFQYHFRLVPPGTLLRHLDHVLEQEKVDVEPGVLPLVVRAGAGSVRDALSILDQLLAGGATDLASARSLLGITDAVLLDEVVESLAARDAAGLFGVVDRVVAAGHDPRRFAEDLLERLRDLILLSAVPDAPDRGLLAGYPPDQLDQMARQGSLLGPAELSRSADLAHAALLDMRGTVSPRLLLELLCARLLLPGAGSGAASWLTRLERLERRLDLTAPQPGVAATGVPAGEPSPTAEVPAPAPARVPVTPPAQALTAGPAPTGPAPTAAPTAADGAPALAPATASSPPPPPVAAGQLDAAALRRVWPRVLDTVKSVRRLPHALLSQYAEVADVRGEELILVFTLPAMATRFRSDDSAEVLAAALTEVVGGRWRITVAVSEPQAAPEGFSPGDGPAEEPESESGPAAARPDPVGLLRQAFGATVISDSDGPAT
jgi:DNA polymerase-3 subunit gamma/tau